MLKYHLRSFGINLSPWLVIF